MSGHADTILRAEGIIEALDRQEESDSEPWLTLASLRVLAVDAAALVAENQQLRDENARLEDGVIFALNAIWKVYEQMQSVARKPSPALAGTPSEDTE